MRLVAWCVTLGLLLGARMAVADEPALGGEAGKWGDLSGRFVYDGEPPEPRYRKVDKDREVAPAQILDERLLVNRENRGIANVVIYIRAAKDNPPPVHPAYEATAKGEATWTIQGFRYEPHILVARTSQTIKMVNKDPISHNPYWNRLDGIGISNLIAPADSITLRATPEPIPVGTYCTIHAWMKGYAVIRDEPYVAVTDKDGRFAIKNLPMGEWKFQAWHEAPGLVRDVAKFGPAGKLATWDRGRFTTTIKPGENDLGDVYLAPKVFEDRR